MECCHFVCSGNEQCLRGCALGARQQTQTQPRCEGTKSGLPAQVTFGCTMFFDKCTCPGGFYRKGLSSQVWMNPCKRCPVGFFCEGSIKSACPRGTFSGGGLTTCTHCHPGWTTSGNRASSAQQCTITLTAKPTPVPTTYPSKHCKGEQVFKRCGTHCARTCEAINSACTNHNCVSRCQCPSHAPYWSDNMQACVLASSCTSLPTPAPIPTNIVLPTSAPSVATVAPTSTLPAQVSSSFHLSPHVPYHDK